MRMENSVPIVPQNQTAQSLQIQPSMLTQVRASRVCEYFMVLKVIHKLRPLNTFVFGFNGFFNCFLGWSCVRFMLFVKESKHVMRERREVTSASSFF